MGVKTLQIIYDNPTTVFMPGQEVSGRVLVITNESVKYRSIKMKISGEAKVKWVEQESRRNSNGDTENYSESYQSEEEYFENKFTLLGGGGESHLEEGEHAYPFNITLPCQLPSTYNGEHGNVHYEAKVTIDIPWGKDKETKSTFQVISALNLNEEANLSEPIKEEKEKYYCCCCCQSGPMTLVVCLPYSGYVPGQNIPITIELDNNSNVRIEAVKVKLEKEITFKATHPVEKKKCETAELAKLSLDGVQEHGSKTWTEQLPIPDSLILSNLKHCDIIKEKYFIKIDSCVGGMNENTTLYVNITMGNIPLTIAHDAPQFKNPNQVPVPPDQYLSNPTPVIGFVQSTPVPGYAQQAPPYGQQYPQPPSVPAPYPHQQYYPLPCDPQSAYPQTQPSYPSINVQQPLINPTFQNLHPQPIMPTAPGLNGESIGLISPSSLENPEN